MPNGNNKTSKPSSDGTLRDTDLVTWLIGFLFFAIIAGAVVQALGGLFGGFGTQDFGIGAVVSADGDVDVYTEPGGSVLGMQEDGVLGEIKDGPVDVVGEVWWFVDFDEDPDGWVSEDTLVLVSAALAVGDVIEMVRDADIWDQVGGGVSNGLQFLGSIGELTEGPRTFNGERWWFVDFDDDPDGWVREIDIKRAQPGFVRLVREFMSRILIPSIVLSFILVLVIVVLLVRTGRVVRALKEKYKTPELSSFVRSKEEQSQSNKRWSRVEELAYSSQPSDWRLAILEADIILADIVARMGYPGETLGERLKRVEKSDFETIDKAWEAHKIRNTIAHEGGDFILTERETRRVIKLYEEVFREFHFI